MEKSKLAGVLRRTQKIYNFYKVCFFLVNRKKDCGVKIKISLFILKKENISLLTCDYVI